MSKLCVLTSQPCRSYSFAEIKSATNDFDETIGQGGFGNVYKGRIDIEGTSQEVAIKRLDRNSNQGAAQFRAEIRRLSKLRHCHVVPLLGYCDEEEEMILVYVYIPGGSLYDHIEAKTPLPMMNLLKIVAGCARGLDYLHTGVCTNLAVIHRDVKCRNILLDENLEAVISDFGMSRVRRTNQLISSHDARKKDVYKLGVVMLELLTGKHGKDKVKELVGQAQTYINEQKLDQMVDPRISGTVCVKALLGFVELAISCLLDDASKRPTMAKIVVSLQDLQELQQILDTTNADPILLASSSSSSSKIMASPGANGSSYDVFLSYRGEDTCDSFADQLYHALNKAEIGTFRDNEESSRGEELKPEIESIIEESKASVVVLSQNYATSASRLDELVLILERRRECNLFVLPIFYHVDRSDVREQNETFAVEVKASSRWTNHNVSLWKKALQEVADLTGMTLSGSETECETEFLEKIVDIVNNINPTRRALLKRIIPNSVARRALVYANNIFHRNN